LAVLPIEARVVGLLRVLHLWVLRWCLLLMATASLSAHATEQGVRAACSSVDSQKCFIDLATGIRMAYVEVGPQEGIPMILLHGLTDSARSWSAAMSDLHQIDPELHIFAVDQRGHGDSSMPSGRSCPENPKACFAMRLFADDLASFIERKKLGKVILAGQSMGSLVTQEMALDYPSKLRAIVLVASTSDAKGNRTVEGILKEPILRWKKALFAKGKTNPQDVWNATALDADPDAAAWMTRTWDVDPFASPALLKAEVKDTTRVKMGTWIGATEAALDVDNSRRLANLSVPTLAIWGTQDVFFLRDPDQKGLLTELGKAAAHGTPVFWKQYGVVPLPASGDQTSDIGHNVQWEAPRQVAEDIDAFLRTGKPTTAFTRVVSTSSGAVIETSLTGASIISPRE
jgi:non-heme chloroperoxidase